MDRGNSRRGCRGSMVAQESRGRNECGGVQIGNSDLYRTLRSRRLLLPRRLRLLLEDWPLLYSWDGMLQWLLLPSNGRQWSGRQGGEVLLDSTCSSDMLRPEHPLLQHRHIGRVCHQGRNENHSFPHRNAGRDHDRGCGPRWAGARQHQRGRFRQRVSTDSSFAARNHRRGRHRVSDRSKPVCARSAARLYSERLLRRW